MLIELFDANSDAEYVQWKSLRIQKVFLYVYRPVNRRCAESQYWLSGNSTLR